MTVHGGRARRPSAVGARGNACPLQRGYVLVTALVAAMLVATVAFLLSQSGAMHVRTAAADLGRDEARYVAEAGMRHALWLASRSDCSAYAGLVDEPFGRGAYTTTLTPDSGSPVSVRSTGVLPGGTAYTLLRGEASVHDAARPVTIQLVIDPAGKDTFIEGETGHTDHNKADDGSLKTSSESGKELRSLLYFDVAAIPPGAKIRSATLELAVTRLRSVDTVEAHRLLRDWSESEATWNIAGAGSSWTMPGGDFDAMPAGSFVVDSEAPQSMDIAALVQGWVDGAYPNHGLLLRSPAGSGGAANEYSSGDGAADVRPRLTVILYCECGVICTGFAAGTTIVLSTDSAATLGGLDFDNVDLAEYDPSADSAALFFDGSARGLGARIDALHVLANGRLVLSTDGNATLGGIAIEDGDLVEYDPLTDSAVLIFDGSELFADAGEKIVSVFLHDNGRIVLSTDGNAELGGLSFESIDVVEYDPAADNASLLLDGSAVGLNATIDALHILENGHLALSTKGTATLGGLSFTDDDLVDYDPAADVATRLMDGASVFAADEKIISAHVGPGSGNVALPAGIKRLLFVVADVTGPGPTASELAHRALLESWGYAVQLIDDDASQAEFDAAVAASDVAYVTQDVSATALHTKLATADIGVVTSEPALVDEFGIASAVGWDSGTLVDVDDNSHYITSPFTPGTLAILASPTELAYASGTLAPGLDTLASSTSGFGILALDAGAESVGGSPAAGRRAQLPWGGSGFDPSNLTDDGRTILKRAIEWGAGARIDTYRDEFNAVSYDGNDGTLQWSNDWQELGESGGPASGLVTVRSSASQCASGGCFRIGGDEVNLTGRGASRSADLSGALGATLSFTIADSGSEASVSIDVSGDGGATWVTLDTFVLGSGVPSTATPRVYDITGYAAADTQIRFIGSGEPDDAAYFYVDDVQIAKSGFGDADAGAGCPADFVPDTETGSFSTSDLGISDPWGVTFLTPGVTFNGVAAPAGGAWLLVDGSNRTLTMTDTGGSSLTNRSIAPSQPRGVAYVASGANVNHLALANAGAKRIDYLDMSGVVQGSISTIGVTEHPVGVTYIGETAGGLYDGHLAIGSDKDGSGASSAGVYIVDQAGNLQAYLDISPFATEPWGLAHVPGTDSFLVADKAGTVFIVGFDAALRGQYSTATYGATQPQSIAIDPATSTHGILDKDSARLVTLGSSACGAGSGSCDGTYLDRFGVAQFDNSDGTLDWSSNPWQEVGESDGPASGDILISSDLGSNRLRIRDNDNGGEGVERDVDLGGAAGATLGYVYRRSGLDSSTDFVTVEISASGPSGPWTELTRHEGPNNDSSYVAASHDISSFAAATTRVRLKSSPNLGGSDIVWFDDLEVACTP